MPIVLGCGHVTSLLLLMVCFLSIKFGFFSAVCHSLSLGSNQFLISNYGFSSIPSPKWVFSILVHLNSIYSFVDLTLDSGSLVTLKNPMLQLFEDLGGVSLDWEVCEWF